jgi:hypothetical protein
MKYKKYTVPGLLMLAGIVSGAYGSHIHTAAKSANDLSGMDKGAGFLAIGSMLAGLGGGAAWVLSK